MKLTVISIKESKSGKSDNIALQGLADTMFGESKSVIYNHAVAKGTCKVIEGEELDVDMSKFMVETNTITDDATGKVSTSMWLKYRG